jgi:hypothetical protein
MMKQVVCALKEPFDLSKEKYDHHTPAVLQRQKYLFSDDLKGGN